MKHAPHLRCFAAEQSREAETRFLLAESQRKLHWAVQVQMEPRKTELMGPLQVSQQQLFWSTAGSLLCHTTSKCKPSLCEHTPFSLKKINLMSLSSEPVCEVTQSVCDPTDGSHKVT